MTYSAISLTGLLLAWAGDVFVDVNAANCLLGDGSVALPYCALSQAVGTASPGDTIHIAPGTYIENLTITKDLTLIGTSGRNHTIIDGDSIKSVFIVKAGQSATFEGLTIRNGYSKIGGGILAEEDSEVFVFDCLIEDNLSVGIVGQGGGGGGIGTALSGPTTIDITIDNSTLSGNRAIPSAPYADDDYGGAIRHTANGELTISNSTLAGNSARHKGGAIFSVDCELTITNTTMSGNMAAIGAAFYAVDPGAGSLLEHVTVTGNVGNSSGGMHLNAVSPFLEVRNSLFADNLVTGTFSDGRQDLVGGLFMSGGFNIVGRSNNTSLVGIEDGINNDRVGTQFAPIDAMLGPLELNGGSTASHQLMPGSPAIDGGDPLQFIATDQRGVPRPFNNFPDVGAVEFTNIFGSLCSGNGGVSVGCTECPCGNDAPPEEVGGCLNRTLRSGLLSATGDTSVSLPAGSNSDLRFSCVGLPPSAFSVLLSGNAVAPQNPANPCFGQNSGAQSASYDGLRCAVQAVKRHGGRASDGTGMIGTSTSPWGGEGAPPAGIAQAMGGFAAGQIRYFQAVYREDPLAGCMRGLNSTQAIGVVFGP